MFLSPHASSRWPAARRRLNLESTPRNRPAMTLLMANRDAAPELKMVARLAYQGGRRHLVARGRGYASGTRTSSRNDRATVRAGVLPGRRLARRARMDCTARYPRAEPTHVLTSEQSARALGNKALARWPRGLGVGASATAR